MRRKGGSDLRKVRIGFFGVLGGGGGREGKKSRNRNGGRDDKKHSRKCPVGKKHK